MLYGETKKFKCQICGAILAASGEAVTIGRLQDFVQANHRDEAHKDWKGEPYPLVNPTRTKAPESKHYGNLIGLYS